MGLSAPPGGFEQGRDFVVNCEPLIPRDDGKRYKNPRHQDLICEFRLIAGHLKTAAHES